MPRDNIRSSLIQKIARQANTTFKGGAESNGFAARHSELRDMLARISAADLRLTLPNDVDEEDEEGAPPVRYMHICETRAFSMGVFLLRGGARIPLHDHPGMHGLLQVLYGALRMRCYDSPRQVQAEKEDDEDGEDDALPVSPSQRAALRRSVLRSVTHVNVGSGPCLLAPHRDNLHQIEAIGGPAAFLDILAPPYEPAEGRDCHYYRVLQPVGQEQQPGQEEGAEVGREVWLLEIPQPDDFCCGGEPYPGPKVSL